MRQSVLALTLIVVFAKIAPSQSKTSKEIDGLVGPVHTATTVYFTLTQTDGIWTESGRRTTSIITYDEDGNDGRFNNAHEVARGCVRKYNDKRQEIERDCGESNNPSSVKMFFSYDEAGYLIEDSQQDGTGKLIRRNTFAFDEKGNMTSVGSYDSDNKLHRKLTWTFDPNGNRAEWTESHLAGEEMVLFEKITSTYDDKGNVLTETQYGNPEGAVMTKFFSYIFDERGNWIKKERAMVPFDSSDLRSKDVELRFITYYRN
jgi:hypothetical protein